MKFYLFRRDFIAGSIKYLVAALAFSGTAFSFLERKGFVVNIINHFPYEMTQSEYARLAHKWKNSCNTLRNEFINDKKLLEEKSTFYSNRLVISMAFDSEKSWIEYQDKFNSLRTVEDVRKLDVKKALGFRTQVQTKKVWI